MGIKSIRSNPGLMVVKTYTDKIFDDILATGDFTSNKYIEDFYTIVK